MEVGVSARKKMSGLCVVSSTIMSVLDGLWWPVFCVFWVMRMMSFVMEKGVPRCIVYPCVVGFVVLGFARGVVDDLDR
jgi:hypothetical protein